LSALVEASATEAAQTMLDAGQGSVLVQEGKDYVGIVTEGDLSQRVIAEIKKPIEVQVHSIMSHPIISIESNKLMVAAFLIMDKNGIRHIAVTEDSKIIGMLSIRNFSAYYVRKFSKRSK
jgi:signal-transduction protein with cAMP-binding, CBS, and nucleotidyltransferase domain